MTRLKISVGILITMTCMSIFFGVLIGRKCSGFIEKAERIRERYSDGDLEGAYDEAVGFESDWEKFRGYSAMLINNEKLLEIERISARIVYMTENEELELQSEVNELIHMLDAMKRGEIPMLSTIF